ncbi:MAG: helix-turn-helix domain-containing protein [Lachnospiraceae bacterium]|nr:helix-turn-helix domain-containing protein [Lachnospiraceae bacterium]
MTVGENIRRIRREKGWTQAQLANELGISQQMIGQYETIEQPQKIDTITKIASALDVSVSDIIGHSTYNYPINTQQYAPIISYIQALGYIVKQIDRETDSTVSSYDISGNGISVSISSDDLSKLQTSSGDFIHSFFWRIQQYK